MLFWHRLPPYIIVTTRDRYGTLKFVSGTADAEKAYVFPESGICVYT